MTALEYMKKQLNKHRLNYATQLNRGAPLEDIENIRLKIRYYEAAVEALRERKYNG